MRTGISKAQWLEKPELASLWKESFGDSSRYISYFFNNLFLPENCMVFHDSGRIVSMLHMLPAWIQDEDRLVQSHYIYAAATRSEYRSRGYMGSLLRAALEEGKQRGDQYSFLLPANRGLYHFYSGFGYTVGFELRTLTVSRQEMEQIAASGTVWQFLPDYSRIQQRRKEWLAGQSGSAQWDVRTIAYADGINRLEHGRLICAMAKGKLAYALCRPAGDPDACEVLELVAEPETFPNLAANLLDATSAAQYYLRLSGDNRLFPGQGRCAGFGMIRSLADGIGLPSRQNPYLGLTLD